MRTNAVLGSPDYKGAAKTLEEYIRESIINPNGYLVPGQTFSVDGQSIMPPLVSVLKPEEIDQLVAYLATFK
jgi:nitric oxide reductase subunit C